QYAFVDNNRRKGLARAARARRTSGRGASQATPWYRGRPKMGWVWRVLIAALLLGGTVAVVPGVETYASGSLNADGSDILRPAPNDNCPNSNPRKQKKCHYNNQDNVDD